jgi:hypothetical protein
MKDDCAILLWHKLKETVKDVTPQSRRGPREKLELSQLLFSLIYHVINPVGKLSIKVKRCSGVEISNAALSQRRQRLPWELFKKVMEILLGNIADECKHTRAFYHDYRLIGIDGTTFSVRNTESTSCLPKRNCNKKKLKGKEESEGYAHINASSLVELGMHNPIAARVGVDNDSEWALGIELIKDLPEDCLLLADRLYGKPRFVRILEDNIKKKGSGSYLLRVGKQPKIKVKEILEDGSVIAEIVVRDRKSQSRIVDKMTIREVRVKLIHPLTKEHSIVRLWTNLIDHKKHPLRELVDLYLKRWEHETYYGTIKSKLTDGSLLRAQSLQTAFQEIASHILASALIAQYRCKAIKNTKDNDPTRISVQKVEDELSVLWRLIEIKVQLNLKPKQIKEAAKLLIQNLLEQMTPKRKQRSCPRGKRRTPRKVWPRIKTRIESNEPVEIEVIEC